MNTPAIALALRALADAIDPGSALTSPPSATESEGGPVKRGRPAKAVAAAAPTPTAAAASPSAVAPAAAADPMAVAATPAKTQVIPPQSQAAPPASPSSDVQLTRALVAPDFTHAGKTHGREFVVRVMEQFGAKTFDQVPLNKLDTFRSALIAGPKPMGADPNAVDDLMG